MVTGDDLLDKAADRGCHEGESRSASAAVSWWRYLNPDPRGARDAQLRHWTAGKDARNLETVGRPPALAGGVA